MQHNELIALAKKAKQNAYSPYSNFKVGAAVLTTSGKVYLGCNVENSSYGASICAERVACCNAVSDGECEFTAIAITSSSGDQTFPCGICRQFLSEFSPNITVVLTDKDSEIHTYPLSELFAHQFKL